MYIKNILKHIKDKNKCYETFIENYNKSNLTKYNIKKLFENEELIELLEEKNNNLLETINKKYNLNLNLNLKNKIIYNIILYIEINDIQALNKYINEIQRNYKNKLIKSFENIIDRNYLEKNDEFKKHVLLTYFNVLYNNKDDSIINIFDKINKCKNYKSIYENIEKYNLYIIITKYKLYDIFNDLLNKNILDINEDFKYILNNIYSITFLEYIASNYSIDFSNDKYILFYLVKKIKFSKNTLFNLIDKNIDTIEFNSINKYGLSICMHLYHNYTNIFYEFIDKYKDKIDLNIKYKNNYSLLYYIFNNSKKYYNNGFFKCYTDRPCLSNVYTYLKKYKNYIDCNEKNDNGNILHNIILENNTYYDLVSNIINLNIIDLSSVNNRNKNIFEYMYYNKRNHLYKQILKYNYNCIDFNLLSKGYPLIAYFIYHKKGYLIEKLMKNNNLKITNESIEKTIEYLADEINHRDHYKYVLNLINNNGNTSLIKKIIYL